MTKKMKSKVIPPCLYGMLMVAIQEARMRATQEYLTRHPNGITSRVGKGLMVAVKAVRVNIRDTYMARRHNLPVPLIAQSNSSSSYDANNRIEYFI